MRRAPAIVILLLGLALIIAPFVIQLPSRGDAGQTMIDSFHPIMQPDHVNQTVTYDDKVFTPLGEVVPAVSAGNIGKFQGYLKGIKTMEPEVPQLISALSQQLHMTPDQVNQFLGTSFPATSHLLAGLPEIDKNFSGLLGLMSQNQATFEQVPAGLAFYKPVVNTMQANVGNYQQVSSLPSFRLFTWFFVVPGALLVIFALFALIAGPRSRGIGALAALGVVVIGAGLIAAPFVVQLPARGDAGQAMMDNFRPIMQPDQVKKTVDYYNNVFVPLGQVAPAINATTIATFGGYAQGMKAAELEVPQLIGALAQQLHMTPAQVQQFLSTSFPATYQLLTGLPAMQSSLAGLVGVMNQHTGSFAQVPAGAGVLQAADRHHAGQRRQLRSHRQPAVLPVVHLVLCRPRCAAGAVGTGGTVAPRSQAGATARRRALSRRHRARHRGPRVGPRAPGSVDRHDHVGSGLRPVAPLRRTVSRVGDRWH